MKYHYETKAVRLPDGTRKYIRGKTKAELEEKLAKLNFELALGIRVNDITTVRDYTCAWLAAARKPNVSLKTYHNLVASAENHIFPYIGAKKVRDVRAQDIRVLVAAMDGLSHGTASHVLSLLRSIFNAAADDQLIVRSPVPQSLKAPGKVAQEPEPLSDAQIEELLTVVAGTLMETFIMLALFAGLRRGEIVTLLWSDVDFDAHTLRVRTHAVRDAHGRPEAVAGAKTAAGVRDAVMHPVLEEYLIALRKTANSVYVAPNTRGQMMSDACVTQNMHTLEKKLSFPLHLHLLRHTYVTRLFEGGLDVKQIQRLVGHANPDLTMKTYTHFREADRGSKTREQVRAINW